MEALAKGRGVQPGTQGWVVQGRGWGLREWGVGMFGDQLLGGLA